MPIATNKNNNTTQFSDHAAHHNEIAAAVNDHETAITGKQALSPELTAIAALSTTAYGRSFLALVDAAAARGLVSAPSQAELQVVADGVSAHLVDAADAHDASAISTVPAGGLSATDVQAALNELDGEKQPLDGDLTAIAALSTTSYGRSLLEAATAAAGRALLALGSPGQVYPKLVAPPDFEPLRVTVNRTQTALQPRGWRVVVPEGGHLRDLIAYIGVSSGNVSFAVYDTGNASAGNRTKLWDSGSIACPAVGWGGADPGASAVAVVAGQQLDVLICADNATASFGGATSATSSAPNLPTAFNVVAGGASPKLAFNFPALGSVAGWSATVAEASVTVSNVPPAILSRVD